MPDITERLNELSVLICKYYKKDGPHRRATLKIALFPVSLKKLVGTNYCELHFEHLGTAWLKRYVRIEEFLGDHWHTIANLLPDDALIYELEQ